MLLYVTDFFIACEAMANFLLLLFVQFEYQQAQLEAEVENLSWKVERAEITDRGVS